MHLISHLKTKAVIILTLIAISLAGYAQAPNLINYQGVARNAVGNPLPNQTINLRLSVHNLSASGTVVYTETRPITTNLGGLFSVQIGSTGASSTTGSIAGVNWLTGDKYLQVEIDPTSNNNYLNMGTVQLISVPYAFNAATAGNALTVTTNANLTGAVTSIGNATSLAASPALTGVPTAPTAAPGTNTTQIATTEFVKAAALTGPTGAKGLQGLAGADGAAGAQGIQGIQGLTGADGAAGVQGIQGIQGLTGSVASVAAISGTSTANGARITSGELSLAPADATNGGIVTTGAQIFAGAKTFNTIITGSINGNATTAGNALTVTTNANLTGVVTSTGNATAIANGAITNAMLANGAVANLSGTNTGDNSVNTLYSGLLTNATHTGDATGSNALTVVKINGTLLSGLPTGILKNTTATGIPSIAVAGDFPTLNQNTSGTATNVTGTVAVANGGSGASSLSGYIIGNGTSPFSTISKIPVTDVTGAVQKVNGSLPGSDGNVTMLFGNVTTGILSSMPPSGSTNGNIYIVSGDAIAANNGRTYISDGANWKEVTSNQAATDARYVQLTAAGVSAVGSISGTSNVKGATISGSTITLTPADASYGGIVTIGDQIFSGAKTFNSNLIVNGLTIGRGAGNIASNIANGRSALSSNTTGAYNTATGDYALRDNTTAKDNTANGAWALRKNITGTENTATGSEALSFNETGSSNTAIGMRAGLSNTTGNNNTFIGTDANIASGALANATAIGNGAMVSADNTIQLGNTSVTNVITSGTIVAGAVTYPNTDGSANQVLTTNGSGSLTWATASTVTTNANLTGPVTSVGNATTITNGAITNAKITDVAATKITGTLPVANGGTGAATLTGIVKGNGTGIMTAAVAGTDFLTPTGSAAGLTNFPTFNQNTTGNAATATTATSAGTATTTTGNAGTATKLATARNINGVAFDGSGDITVTADAETLTGTTLKSTVTGSSLTSVGTIASLTTGAITNSGKVIVGASSAASGSAVLEASSTTQGFLPPRLNYYQKTQITSPVAGLTIWCSNCGASGEMQVFNGGAWTNMSGGTATGTISLSIGNSYQGGKVAYILVSGDPGYDANTPHGLIAATSDQSSGIRWYNGSNTTTGATGTAIGTGLANTNTIITSQGATATSYAAELARAYTGGGYSDWYLPSKDELNKLYLNRVAIGGFPGTNYWSSTEHDNANARHQDVSSGVQNYDTKNNAYYVRAIRAF
jgi:hypothetical protein